ncbi:hypothetical protein CRG98_013953 [Punica granatum]|uniref:Peptidase A1 domain-containing protein n=1 Tax=Punica granatum TaxID=22663 RepID=A0A2I0KAT7_PUNGR|nr:hypothetical protein CRG98_013953 [Punica granatum]
MKKALRCPIVRASRLSSMIGNPRTRLPAPRFSLSGDGEYLLNISIGTPPIQLISIMDTGSDLTWTQCKYCTRCFSLQTPLFNPNKSSTYASVSCNSKECRNQEYYEDIRTGIIRIGGSAICFASQLGQYIDDNQFSYCLGNPSMSQKSSKLNFGSNAVDSGPGTVSIPFKFGSGAYYYLYFKGSTVSNKTIKFTGASSGSSSLQETLIKIQAS